MKPSTAASLGLVLVCAAMAANVQSAPPSFDSLDTDSNNDLSLEELSAFFARCAGGQAGGPAGPRADRPAPEIVFVHWDADGDGAVSREEWDNRPRRRPGGPPGHAPPSLPPNAF